MHAESISQQNSAAGLVPPIQPVAPWRVASVRAMDNYTLQVEFMDGTKGEVRLAALIKGDRAGLFSLLADPEEFASVGLEHGAVTWPVGVDLAPDAMHDAIREHGTWVLS